MVDPICPNCFREYVVRVRREKLIERLLSVFYIYPFCCQLCGERFAVRQPGVKYVRIDEDRRTYERFPISFPVEFAGDQVHGEGAVSDISMAGCAIETDARLALGEILRVSLKIPKELRPVTVEAALVRDVNRNRVGLQFLRFEQAERKQLQDFIYTLMVGRWTANRTGVAAAARGSAPVALAQGACSAISS